MSVEISPDGHPALWLESREDGMVEWAKVVEFLDAAFPAERERLAKLLDIQADQLEAAFVPLAVGDHDSNWGKADGLHAAAALIRAENDGPYSKPALDTVLHAHKAGVGHILDVENEPRSEE